MIRGKVNADLQPFIDLEFRTIRGVFERIEVKLDTGFNGELALNYGWPKEQIVELITQMLFYGGYPACVNALGAAEQAFEEYDERHAGD